MIIENNMQSEGFLDFMNYAALELTINSSTLAKSS